MMQSSITPRVYSLYIRNSRQNDDMFLNLNLHNIYQLDFLVKHDKYINNMLIDGISFNFVIYL